MKLLKWIKKTWLKFRSGWNNLDDKVKKVSVIAVKVCEAIKNSVDNGTFDTASSIADSVIPGDQQPLFKIVKAFIKEKFPRIIIQLQIVGDISGLNNADEEMKAIINRLKLLSNDEKNKALQEISGIVVDYFSDGVLSKGELKSITDYAYQHFIKDGNSK